MRTRDQSLYDNSLIGVMTRLTHDILFEADTQNHEPRTSDDSSGDDSRTPPGWLDRLDTWFWKQEMKQREAFLAKSLDIFDLEQRMRCLERGDRWLGTDRVDPAN